MYIDVFDFEKGLSELDKELQTAADNVRDINALNAVLETGAKPLVDEIKNQIRLKARHTSAVYRSGKRKPGGLIKSVTAESQIVAYLQPRIKIGFTKKGAHSNILENSATRVLRHIKPAWDLREEECKKIMLSELQKIINQK